MTEETTPETTPSPTKETITIDVYGEQVEVPYEAAKKIISKRETNTKEYQELSSRLKEHEQQLAKAKEKELIIDKLKNQEIEAAKELLTKEAREKLGKFQNKFIRNELKGTLLAQEAFIGASAVDDAIALLVANNEFDLGDDDTIKSKSGKSVDEVVKEFLSNKPLFTKTKNPVGTGGATSKATSKQIILSPSTKMANGLEKLMKR